MASEAVLTSSEDQLSKVNRESGEVGFTSSELTLQENGDTPKQVEIAEKNNQSKNSSAFIGFHTLQ